MPFTPSTTSSESPLKVFDTRLDRIVKEFSFSDPTIRATISRYIFPSWHKDGNLVFFSVPSEVPQIAVWDIRNLAAKPAFSFPIHKRKILQSKCHYSQDLIVTASTDGCLGFIDFDSNAALQ